MSPAGPGGRRHRVHRRAPRAGAQPGRGRCSARRRSGRCRQDPRRTPGRRQPSAGAGPGRPFDQLAQAARPARGFPPVDAGRGHRERGDRHGARHDRPLRYDDALARGGRRPRRGAGHHAGQRRGRCRRTAGCRRRGGCSRRRRRGCHRRPPDRTARACAAAHPQRVSGRRAGLGAAARVRGSPGSGQPGLGSAARVRTARVRVSRPSPGQPGSGQSRSGSRSTSGRSTGNHATAPSSSALSHRCASWSTNCGSPSIVTR